MALVAATRSGLVRIDGDRVQATIAADARCLVAAGGHVWAGTQDNGVLRSADGGRTWEAAGLGGMKVKALAATDGVLYAGTQPPRLFVGRDGIWTELEAFARMRRPWWWQPADRPPTAYVSALAVAGETILAGIEAWKALASDDGGRSWRRLGRGLALGCHALAIHPRDPRRAYEGAGLGTAESRDGGHTWRRTDEGLDRRYVMCAAIDPDDTERWYVAAAPLRSAHGRNSRACVFRRHGSVWEKLAGGLPTELEQLPHALVAAGQEVYAGLRDGTIWASADRGDSWAPLAVRLDGLRALVRV